MKRWIVGDIHGCFFTLKTLLKRFEDDYDQNLLVFVGDLIDRGPFSREVVGIVRSLVDNKKAICLRGNHEQMAIDAHKNSADAPLWLYNGGNECLESYARHENQLKSDVDWFSTLPLSFQDDDWFIVHAGVNSDFPLSDQTGQDLLWIRNKFLMDKTDFGKMVVFGHTPMKDVFISDNRIGVDTGCVFGNKLSAFCLETKEIRQFVKHEKDGFFPKI